MNFPVTLGAHVKLALRTVWYLAILVALFVLYADARFTVPNFIYQGF